eukprot:COSAG04_NODE_1876_length_5329_cov_70.433078_7_plen_88_part_00
MADGLPWPGAGAYEEGGPLSTFKSGGEGLTSTISDYYAFCACLLNGGASLDGSVRILGRRTRPQHWPAKLWTGQPLLAASLLWLVPT